MATPPDQAPPLNRPPWLAAAAFAGLATLLVCYPAWPGMMSYDSLIAWDQALYGVRTALWPPLHTYLFQLSAAAHGGPGGLFAAQTFILLYGATLALRTIVPGRSVGWGMALMFVGGLAWFPALLGSLLAHWRDVPTGSFIVMGVALWLAAAQARSRALLLLAIAAMGVAVALRYNAFVLAAPLMAAMLWRPFLAPRPGASTRAFAALAMIVAVGLAWASTQWRLPDGSRLPPTPGFGAAQLFDVIGVSACSGHNYLPAAVSAGQPVTVDQLRLAYDPRHLQRTLAPRPGVPRLVETDASGEVPRVWRRLLLTETSCYIAHRNAVFVEQMGLAKAGVFYPVHDGIDANPYGLKLSRPAAARAMTQYVSRNADEPWRRPCLPYLAAVAFAWAAIRRERRLELVFAALVAGVVAYPALLYVAAPAADARYIFPSGVLALLTALIGLGVLASRPAAAAQALRASS